MTNQIKEILFAFTDAEVEFVVGGGVAAVLQGVTLDGKLKRLNSSRPKIRARASPVPTAGEAEAADGARLE